MIIFLDIDGVLVSYLNFKDRSSIDGENCFKWEAVKALNEIIKYYDAKIVISSSWRIGKYLKDLKKILKIRGVQGEIIGKTNSGKQGIRGIEIEDWMDENDYHGQYIIIDDEICDIKDYHKSILRPNRYRCLDEFDVIELKRNSSLINFRN